MNLGFTPHAPAVVFSFALGACGCECASTTETEGVTMETPNEMRAKVVGKAAEDAEFRARLLSDPKAAIGQSLGVTMPESLSVEVHEESGTTAHLVLPPASKLSEGDLQAVTGGSVMGDIGVIWRVQDW